MDVLYHIKDLLYSRNGLVIPGFGSIVVHYYPAGIDKQKNKIFPPRRKYSFNPLIKTDSDKILIKRLVSNYNVTEKQAGEQVKEFVEDMEKTLDSGKEFSISGIGSFKKDEKGKVRFVQEEQETMGLESLKVESFELEKTEVTKKEEPEKKSPPPPKRKKGRFFRIALLVLLVLFIVGGYFSGFFEFYIEKYTSIDKQKQRTQEKKQPANSEKHTAKDTTDEMQGFINGMTDKKEALMYQYEEDKNEYHLIAGSFQRRKNAEEFQEKIRNEGFKSTIIEKDGLFRVSIETYNNKEEALVSLHHMRDTSPYRSVWLLTVEKKDR
ncbi:MAG: SPOR domain-containing protein [Bacteroidales bacterium]